MAEPEPMPREIAAYYARGGETRRLFAGHGQIELVRTQEIIRRHLPPAPGTILGVGAPTVREPGEPLLQDGVRAVPEGEGEAEVLPVVGDPPRPSSPQQSARDRA